MQSLSVCQEKGECSKADCKFGHSMLGLELESEDFEFGTQCYHGMSIEQLARATGLCLEFVKVGIINLLININQQSDTRRTVRLRTASTSI